jgi:hypothetical protein
VKPKPVRVLSANLHTTSNPAVVVPWLWWQTTRHRIHACTLQEVTPRHASWLRRRPGWALVKHPETQEALYARRRQSAARRVWRLPGTGWKRTRAEGQHPGRSLPLATLRGWLVVGSVHVPPAWEDGPEDRQLAGLRYLELAAAALPELVPLYLDGDWNAKPGAPTLKLWRQANNIPGTIGHRIIHGAERGCIAGAWIALGRARGMDHDAHMTTVAAVKGRPRR